MLPVIVPVYDMFSSHADVDTPEAGDIAKAGDNFNFRNRFRAL